MRLRGTVIAGFGASATGTGAPIGRQRAGAGIAPLLGLLLLAVGCAGDADEPLPDLGEAAFVFAASDSTTISMVGGEGEGPNGLRAGVTDWVLRDDIDEDGAADALAVVWSSGEGDVILYEVARLEVVDGLDGALAWEWRGSVPLGDRVRIRALTLASDMLGVHLTRHGPDDEACCPTEEVEVRFRVEERSFSEVETGP